MSKKSTLISTPMNFPWHKTTKPGETLVDPAPFQRLLDRLIYLTHTRPDITFVVHHLSQFIVAPIDLCWHEKPRWFASWRFDEDWMKLFWTILKPLPFEWSLHWWRKGDLMISMVIKA